MKMGVFADTLSQSFMDADDVFFYASPDLNWDINTVRVAMSTSCKVFQDIETMVNRLVAESRSGAQIVIMSNGSFGGLKQQLLTRLCDYRLL